MALCIDQKLLRKVECAGQFNVAGEKLVSQGMLVDRLVAFERKVDMLEKKMDRSVWRSLISF